MHGLLQGNTYQADLTWDVIKYVLPEAQKRAINFDSCEVNPNDISWRKKQNQKTECYDGFLFFSKYLTMQYLYIIIVKSTLKIHEIVELLCLLISIWNTSLYILKSIDHVWS